MSIDFMRRICGLAAVLLGCGCAGKGSGSGEPVESLPSGISVILIPGITGSALIRPESNDQVWPPRLLSASGDFAALQIRTDGKSEEHINAGEPLMDFYGPMVRSLEAAGHKVYPFGYDWRLDNAINAEKLATFLDATGAAQVAIVAHSMGGLISANYLHRFGQQKVAKLLTLGTPFLGTPGSLKTLERGDYGQGLVAYLVRPKFRQLFKNEVSWYQLLPNREFFRLQPAYVRKVVRGATDSTTEIRGYEATAAFIRSRPWSNHGMVVSNDRLFHQTDLLKTLASVDAYFIIGDGQPTVGGLDYIFKDQGGHEVYDDCEPVVADGDGAVLRRSANIGGKTEALHPGHSYYVAMEHGAMIADELVLRQIAKILRGDAAPLPGVRGQAE